MIHAEGQLSQPHCRTTHTSDGHIWMRLFLKEAKFAMKGVIIAKRTCFTEKSHNLDLKVSMPDSLKQSQ